MRSFDDIGRSILRNKLLGRWAAEKLGKAGHDAKSYEDALAANAVEDGDVFSIIRKDFDLAGIVLSDTEILQTITQFTIQAGNQLSGPRGGASDAAAVALKRNLMTR